MNVDTNRETAALDTAEERTVWAGFAGAATIATATVAACGKFEEELGGRRLSQIAAVVADGLLLEWQRRCPTRPRPMIGPVLPSVVPLPPSMKEWRHGQGPPVSSEPELHRQWLRRNNEAIATRVTKEHRDAGTPIDRADVLAALEEATKAFLTSPL